MTAEPMTDAQRRQAERQLRDWRTALPVAREQLARETDDLEELRARHGRLLGEKRTVGGELYRRRVEQFEEWPAGRERWSALEADEGPLAGAVNELHGRVHWRRGAIAALEAAIRTRAADLGVQLAPGEVPPPPAPPPQQPGLVELSLARRAQQGA